MGGDIGVEYPANCEGCQVGADGLRADPLENKRSGTARPGLSRETTGCSQCWNEKTQIRRTAKAALRPYADMDVRLYETPCIRKSGQTQPGKSSAGMPTLRRLYVSQRCSSPAAKTSLAAVRPFNAAGNPA